MSYAFGPRRGQMVELSDRDSQTIPADTVAHLDELDLLYRSLCTMLYNYVPMSGHPGGSISSGRMVAGLLFRSMDYDPAEPDRDDADIISYAAGHKALGLYAMWALRTEILRLGAPELLPGDEKNQLRLEDLLGFRRNPTHRAPYFRKLQAKALDGHPTPATPFVRLATGASGVGVASSLGLAFGARDAYGPNAPRVHIVEGEGGLTPGRVAEALAGAGTSSLDNVVLHLDWNQASIDSDRVCRDGDVPGDYVQWTPAELFYLHDWNVITVPDGHDVAQVLAAQERARGLSTTQPTAVVYRTVKGWQYGIEGRKSHGAGHKLCSDAFFDALEPLLDGTSSVVPRCCDLTVQRCAGTDQATVMEECFWKSLQILREEIGRRMPMVESLAAGLRDSRRRLDEARRTPRADGPRIERVYETATAEGGAIPDELRLKPGDHTTLRGELGRALGYYNKKSEGAFLVAAADLLGSTSVNAVTQGFPDGYFNAHGNPGSRTLSIGGICEDAISGVFSGLGSFGRHIGVASSYAAFLAPLGHISARLHAIGNQARRERTGDANRPMILVCAHAGLKTGEDGPTHADPQALQLLQENFPAGMAITLTPWDPQEIWTLISAALEARPALIAPFVTRPAEAIPDRNALGLAPETAARTGLYCLREATGSVDGTVVLQGSGVAMTFVNDVLPRLKEEGINLHVYYVASAELFDRLTPEEQDRIYPADRANEAFGITGFTLPTLYRWIPSRRGREMSLHPFTSGLYPGSGQAASVLAQAGLDVEGQLQAVRRYAEARVTA